MENLVLKIKKLTDGYFRADVSSNSPKWAPIIFDFPSELKKGMLYFPVKSMPEIVKKITPELSQKESYRINIDENGVLIEGADDTGIY